MAKSKVNELASKLNSMKNPLFIGVSIAEVVKLKPFSVSLAGGNIILTEGEELFVCESLKKRTHKASIKGGNIKGELSISNYSEDVSGQVTYATSDGTLSGTLAGSLNGSAEGKATITDIEQSTTGGTITIDPEIKKGELVLVIPTADEQTWIAVDRIGG